jgi:hypothetical protein
MPRKEDVEYIMVHCSATPPDWMAGKTAKAKTEEIRRWHVEERGWKDIAYARVIDRDGKVVNGRDLDSDGDVYEEVGAGAKGWNRNAIHLCLIGGFGSSSTDEFMDNYTLSQDRVLRHEIELIFAWLGRKVKVIGHNDVAAKACPGFDAKRWWKHEPPRELIQSSTMQAAGGGAVATVTAGGTIVSQLDGNAQIVALVAGAVILLAFLWIARERVKKWIKGVR